MSVTFIEERLLDTVAYGSQFGHEFNTQIVTLRSGVEVRNSRWAMPKGQFIVKYENLDDIHHELVYNAHMACRGSAIGFRLKNWVDYYAEDQKLAIGTGAPQTAQLLKEYPFGPTSLFRPIVKPVPLTIELYSESGPIVATVATQTGLVTFTAPEGEQVYWSGEYDFPVRFMNDRLDVDVNATSEQGRLILSSDIALIEDRSTVEVLLGA